MSSFMYQLPTEIIGHVLSLLDFKHISAVDKATLHTAKRATLIEAMKTTSVQSHELKSSTLTQFLAWNKVRNIKVVELSVELHGGRWNDVQFVKKDHLLLAGLLYQAKIIHLRGLSGMYGSVSKLVTIPEIGGKVKTAHVSYGFHESISADLATCCVNLTSIIIPATAPPEHTMIFCSMFQCWECLLSITLWPGGSSCAPEVLQLLEYLRRARCLRELDWWVTEEFPDQESGLLAVFQSCSQLEKVCLSFGCRVHPSTQRLLKGLATGCRGLRELRVDGATVAYSAMRDLLASCARLESLRVESIDYPQHFLQVMMRQPSSQLKTLEVPCNLFQPYQSNQLAASMGELSVDKPPSVPALPSLRHLTVTGDCTEHCHAIADRLCGTAHNVETLVITTGSAMAAAVVDTLAVLSCPSLTSLSIHYGRWITDKSLLGLVTTHPHLRSLCLHRTGFLSDASLSAVAQHCPALRHLEVQLEWASGVGGFGDDGVTALLKSCPSLQHVEINGCYNCTDAVLDAAAHYGEWLECLLLQGTDLRLAGPGIVRLLSGCPRLRRCELSLGQVLSTSEQQEVDAAAAQRWSRVALQLF